MKKNNYYSGEMSPENNSPSTKSIEVQFRENRKFDLRVGRETVTFRGRETKSIPEKWLKTADWNQQKDKFVVRG